MGFGTDYLKSIMKEELNLFKFYIIELLSKWSSLPSLSQKSSICEN